MPGHQALGLDAYADSVTQFRRVVTTDVSPQRQLTASIKRELYAVAQKAAVGDNGLTPTREKCPNLNVFWPYQYRLLGCPSTRAGDCQAADINNVISALFVASFDAIHPA